MRKVMTGSDLLRLLQKIEKEQPALLDLPVASHALNHTSYDGDCRLALLDTYKGQQLCVGNLTKKNIGRPNVGVNRLLDDGRDIPEEWSRY